MNEGEDRDLCLDWAAAIQALPGKYRQVLIRRDVEQRSTAEVADALKLTQPAVKSRLHVARLMVRKELNAYGARHRSVGTEMGQRRFVERLWRSVKYG